MSTDLRTTGWDRLTNELVRHVSDYRSAMAQAATQVPRPASVLLGIAGGVSSGKSTAAVSIAAELTERGMSVSTVALDSFIFSGAELGAAGLHDFKGFPNTYHFEQMLDGLASLKSGQPIRTPTYSHEIYDIVEGLETTIEPADVVIAEGLHVLRSEAFREVFDVSVFVDAPPHVAREWFLTRFRRLVADAHQNPDSFYRWALEMTPTDAESLVLSMWDGINERNRVENIAPTQAFADFVATPGPLRSVVVARATSST